MPLDGSGDEAALYARLENENPQLTLKHAMFEVRPPATKTAGYLVRSPVTDGGGRPFLPVGGAGSAVKALATLMTKKEVMALVGVCRDHARLMAQNAEMVPFGRGYADREISINNVVYYSPHGFIDYYLREALGTYLGCAKSLDASALIYLGFLEKQHRSIHRLRRRGYEQELEFRVLLEAA